MTQTIDFQQLRSVASSFATGVTVITTKFESGMIHGMTASSFVSVSFTPPLVLFSVGQKTQLFPQLDPTLKFGISILSSDQQNVSDHFAGQSILKGDDIFDDQRGMPIIKNCLAWYIIKVDRIIPAGDHHLVLGEVIDLSREKNQKPLLYFSGKYLYSSD